ncbi:MAG: MFS transporter [Planctomycetes bacterium]|nr:MFS transporter [Planctomycetota bacterium]
MAAIGFGFDIYVLLVGQYIVPPALDELLGIKPGDPGFNRWRGILFFVPAFVGGIFGLLGGYLTDLLGRRRVLTASILLYALSTFASGYSTSVEMLLVFRCLTFIGVCVEFVAAVAWVAELFPSHEQRERALGYTQAFSSLGGLGVSTVFVLMTAWASQLPPIVLPEFLSSQLGAITGSHAAWRYTLISGVFPALPLIIIRPFLPESPAWKAKKQAGTLKRPSFRELFAPKLRRTTIITTIMFACSYGAAFGAIQQVPSMVKAMPQYQEKAENLSKPEQDKLRNQMAGQFGMVQEVGGLIGRFMLAFLAIRILSRRSLLRVFQLPGLVLMPLAFAFAVVHNRVLFTLPFSGAGTEVTMFHVGIFLAGLCTVAQFSFWGNYLPAAYPLHLRGTGEGFAANIGGRVFGTAFAWVTSEIAGLLTRANFGSDAVNMAYTAAGVALFVYLVGSIACSFLPEPKQELAD